MRLYITQDQWNDAPDKIKEFIIIWKNRKKYPLEPPLTFQEAVEALIAFSFDLHREEILSGVKNYVLDTEDFVMAWESDEPIDDMWYKIVQTIKRRIIIAGTFNQEIEN